jgi:hypothetical protein
MHSSPGIGARIRAAQPCPGATPPATYTCPKIRADVSPRCRDRTGKRCASLAVMPLEGHWQRVNTPLRRLTRRERNVAAAASASTLAVCAALVLATLGGSRPAPAPGCIYAIVPGVMGAAPVDACGARARRICASNASLTDPGARAIEASCRQAGIG